MIALLLSISHATALEVGQRFLYVPEQKSAGVNYQDGRQVPFSKLMLRQLNLVGIEADRLIFDLEGSKKRVFTKGFDDADKIANLAPLEVSRQLQELRVKMLGKRFRFASFGGRGKRVGFVDILGIDATADQALGLEVAPRQHVWIRNCYMLKKDRLFPTDYILTQGYIGPGVNVESEHVVVIVFGRPPRGALNGALGWSRPWTATELRNLYYYAKPWRSYELPPPPPSSVIPQGSATWDTMFE